MRRLLSLRLIAAATGLVVGWGWIASNAAPAEEPATTRVQTEANPPAAVLEIVGGALARGKGKSATLDNVVDALRERYPNANVVMAPGLEKVRVSDLKLRSGTLWEDLEAICIATGGKFEWKSPGSPWFSDREGPIPSMFEASARINPTTGLLDEQPHPNTGLFVLRPPQETPENARVLEAFNIGPYIDWLCVREIAERDMPKSGPERQEVERKIRDTATADGLEQAQEIIAESLAALNEGRTDGEEHPSFQFHRGANLLVVIGTRKTLEVAHKVISALPGQPSRSGPYSAAGGQPGRYPGESPVNMAPSGNPGSAGQEQDPFRRRYGLGAPGNAAPSAPTPGQPGAPPR